MSETKFYTHTEPQAKFVWVWNLVSDIEAETKFHTHTEPQAQFLIFYSITFTFFDSNREDKSFQNLQIIQILQEFKHIYTELSSS
jgi:hypothetical protein